MNVIREFIADIGKEGAMVFKMLKGFGRLMLTTAVLCSVGLFLCGNEVKADPAATTAIVKDTGSDITVQFYNKEGSDVKIKAVKLMIDGITDPIESGEITPHPTVTDGNTSDVLYSYSKSKLLSDYKSQLVTAGKILVTDAVVITETDSTLGGGSVECPPATKIQTITVKGNIKSDPYNTAASSSIDTFTIGGRNYKATSGDHIGYGFKDEEIIIKTAASDTVKANYYECIGDGNEKWYNMIGDTTTPAFTTPGTEKKGNVKETPITYNIQYFPKFTATVESATQSIYLKEDGTYGASIEVPYTTAVASGETKDKTVVDANVVMLPALNVTANIVADSFTGAKGTTSGKGELKPGTKAVLTSDATPGTGTITVKAYTNEATPQAAPLEPTVTGSVALTVYPALKDVTFSPASIEIIKSSTQNVVLAPVPAGADISKLWERVGTGKYSLTFTDSKKVLDQANCKFAKSGADEKGAFIIASSKKTGTATATLSFTVPETGKTITKSIDVKVVTDTTLDAEKSAKNINSSYNYITVGYELSLSSLINNNLVTGEGKKASGKLDYIIWDDDDDASKFVESYKSLTDEASKPSKTLKGKAEGTVKFTAVLESGEEIEGISVGIYPMPKATYGSDHKVTVSVPAKVATEYGDGNAIGSGKGFKLIMEDSSGNSLYEYDDSKYQTVVSSPKDYKTDVAVSAADIEAMVTNAATNGRFSGDTQVKFKVIPMGYKQGSSSEITKANSAVNAKTDGAQVYQLKSSGTNFADSFAYGLDGMTVNLTASPNTGFTFAKWTDGVTSNPRSIKVAGSGSRIYTPEAKESAAAGAGGDNSGLYDDVPKTAESNAAIWLIVFMVFAVMGTGYALYLQLTAATSKNGK